MPSFAQQCRSPGQLSSGIKSLFSACDTITQFILTSRATGSKTMVADRRPLTAIRCYRTGTLTSILAVHLQHQVSQHRRERGRLKSDSYAVFIHTNNQKAGFLPEPRRLPTIAVCPNKRSTRMSGFVRRCAAASQRTSQTRVVATAAATARRVSTTLLYHASRSSLSSSSRAVPPAQCLGIRSWSTNQPASAAGSSCICPHGHGSAATDTDQRPADVASSSPKVSGPASWGR